jgi:hypothetical protein
MEAGQERAAFLRPLFEFIRKPTYDFAVAKGGIQSKLWAVFRIWCFSFIIAVMAGILILIVTRLVGFSVTQNLLFEMFAKMPVLEIIFLAFIWAPITEEITFRMWLRFSPFKLGFSLAFVLLLLIKITINIVGNTADFVPKELFGNTSFLGAASTAGFVLFFGLLFSLLFKKKLKVEKVKSFYSKNFTSLFFLSATAFALMHLFNYPSLSENWFLAPLLVVSQFISGFFLGFVRMRYGLQWAMTYHSIFNIAAATPILLIKSISAETLEVIKSRNTGEVMQLPLGQIIAILAAFCIILLLFLVAFVVSVYLLWEFFKKNKAAKAIKNI